MTCLLCAVSCCFCGGAEEVVYTAELSLYFETVIGIKPFYALSCRFDRVSVAMESMNNSMFYLIQLFIEPEENLTSF